MRALPSLFLSHGAPTLAMEPGPTSAALARLGERLGRPTAILCISAHWLTAQPTVTLAEAPVTIHDFSGFPPALMQARYPAAGFPALARRVLTLLKDGGVEGRTDDRRGLDHGVWVPLSLMYPGAEVPVVQLSLCSAWGPREHLMIGRCLAPLRSEGILVLGSGGASHNLSELRYGEDRSPAPSWVTGFDAWLTGAVTGGRDADLIRYRDLAPEAPRNHPTEDHLLPLFVAMGAGGAGCRGEVVHAGLTHGVLSMTCFAFPSGLMVRDPAGH